MKITPEEVLYVARLARLNLAPEEVGPTTEQLGRILAYVEKLDALDTSGVAATSHALAVSNAFRDDVVRPSLPQAEALANGPLVNGEAFVVPKVI
ncbi:MAG: Asp-tRNA(Asn)/Glu-tRNA(Gln) amidotransferase subunit GatC [Thermodesulfobacteriota bacterium]